MGERKKWDWDVPVFGSMKSLDRDEDPGRTRRYSTSVAPLAAAGSAAPPKVSKPVFAAKLQRLKDQVRYARDDFLELRQEATDLREYSTAKLDRVTRYLGVLAERTRKLDQVAHETEARITPLIHEKKRLFNELLTAKGNVKVFCRVRPLYEDEGLSVVEFPDDCTIRVNTSDDSLANPKKDFEFDRVYGPHVGYGVIFQDVQPYVQSAMDGHNVSIFAFGQTHSGKTHMMEGSTHERGIYVRCFEELFDLFNSDTTSTSRYDFFVSVFELYNEEIGDVLSSLTSKKDIIPYENSRLTKVLADSMGGSSKTLMIVNICPSSSNLARTLSSLNFAARARNAELSLGNRDTIKKWRDVLSDSVEVLKQTNLVLSVVVMIFFLSENIALGDKNKSEKEQNSQLRNHVAQLLQIEQDHKIQIHERDLAIQNLQAKLKSIESQLNEALHSSDARSTLVSESGSTGVLSTSKEAGESIDSSSVTKKLEEELAKRDALIEVSSPSTNGLVNLQTRELGRNDSTKPNSLDVSALPSTPNKTDSTVALVKSGPEKGKTTPAGEYLTAALMDFDPEQYDSPATIADGANKLLMLVLAAVIKAGAAREHEILAEIRDAVFSFIRKLEPRRVMDTMLVSRVRILYIRSLLARSTELQSIKVSPVERFLEKANTGRSRSSSRGSSPGRSPVHYDPSMRNSLIDEHIHGFKVNIKQEKKSKFSSIVLKLRGIDQEMERQHVTGGKLREMTEEAKSFAVGNKALAALFVHTPAGELQRQIRSWLAENFEFLSVTGSDAVAGATGQLELLSTAIMDGWMAGLGAAQPPSTDALGQLLSEYSRRVYSSQLQHLKDIAGTLATEAAEDSIQVNKLRSALESVDHKRRKILQQMRSDTALLTKEEGGSPIQNPSTAAEEARLASLISLDGILKQVKEIVRQASVSSLTKNNKKKMLASLQELSERMPSLLDVDHPCAQKQIADAHRLVESIREEDDHGHEVTHPLRPSTEAPTAEIEVSQWNEPKGGEIIRVMPRPSILTDKTLDEMKQLFSELPEALSVLALARTADGLGRGILGCTGL
ncbi:Geminivirus Rep-interacting motor protein [Acorus calamus]|uniref:Geminivirus Rep-interacting motor protein n=1 Tax=Acorus calamus TaxID=4465 RepID=A0AAV9CHM7_ACOCL|nr:Geminivirus Rep-interacting motor protein [Acorus calamus]